jgi:hypothetical protein
MDVLAPVNNDKTTIARSIKAEILYTIMETGFCEPPKTVTNSTSKPMKHSVRPSATHSIVIIRLLSSDIDPKPLTIDLVGTIWAIPHRVIRTEPVYSIMSFIMGIPS